MPADERATLTPEEHEEIMQRWDKWRAYIANGGGGSWPRDAFETLLDNFSDRLKEADRLAREDAARIAENYDHDRGDLYVGDGIAAAIRASITTDEGMT